MIREISSAANPFFKQLRALATSRKARAGRGAFILEGWRGIQTLIGHPEARHALETLVVSDDALDDPRLPAFADTVRLPGHLFDKVSDVEHAQGVLGVVRLRPAPFCVPGAGHLLLLDNLRDPGNLGTLVRCAAGARFGGILLYGDCVEPFNPKAVRASMGTVAFTGLWHIGDAEVESLRAAGYDLCAATGRGGANLYETRFGAKTVLMVGSEARGLSPELEARATRRITIPLDPACESLNAAVAGAVCMFQIACGRPGAAGATGSRGNS